jgi:hypothetical protein
MSTTSISSREFKQDSDRGESDSEPLIIAPDEKRTAHQSIADSIAQTGDDIDFHIDFPRCVGDLKPADFD